MGPLREPCAFRAGRAPQAEPWLAAPPAKAYLGIVFLAQAVNFLSANRTLPCSENSSNRKAFK